MPYYAVDKDGKFEGWDLPKKFDRFVSCETPDGELDCSEVSCESCIFGCDAKSTGATERFIRYGDLTKIDTQLGLLPENIKMALLMAAKEGRKIQRHTWYSTWETDSPEWAYNVIYRVAPDWKPEEKQDALSSIPAKNARVLMDFVKCIEKAKKEFNELNELIVKTINTLTALNWNGEKEE